MLIRIGQELVINTAQIRWVEFGYNGDMRVPDAHFTRIHWADASAEPLLLQGEPSLALGTWLSDMDSIPGTD